MYILKSSIPQKNSRFTTGVKQKRMKKIIILSVY